MPKVGIYRIKTNCGILSGSVFLNGDSRRQEYRVVLGIRGRGQFRVVVAVELGSC